MKDKKKKVLITGVLGGIGSGTAWLFKENGWYVIGLDVVRHDSPQVKKQEREKEYIDQFFNIDLSDPDEIERFCKSFSEKHKNLEALVNNAAIMFTKSLFDTSVKRWDETFAVNVRGPFLLSKLLYPCLKASKGSVVNISSVHAQATSKDVVAYAASKGALSALTRVIALEFAEDGIRVNAVLPGAVDTDMLKDGFKRNNITNESFVEKHPIGRIGVPKDVAELIYFLANNERAGFITGQEFVVDGGVLAHLSTE